MTQLRLFDLPQTEYTSDDYWTPKWIFESLGLTFDIDVASPPQGPAHTPCLHYYTQADDGLAQNWHGTVFMNPPFSKPTPWVHKYINHANGIALLPMSKSNWFNQLWTAAHAITPLPSNLKFDQGSIFMPTVLIAMGDVSTQALKQSKIGHVR